MLTTLAFGRFVGKLCILFIFQLEIIANTIIGKPDNMQLLWVVFHDDCIWNYFQLENKNYIQLSTIFLLLSVIFSVDHVFAQDGDEINEMLNNAQESFLGGEYKVAIKIYDELLEIDPKNYKILDQ